MDFHRRIDDLAANHILVNWSVYLYSSVSSVVKFIRSRTA